MRTMTVFEAKNQFSKALKEAENDVVIVTRRGKPVAALHAITEEDLEDYLLERSPKFWEMIRRARKGKSVSLAAVKEQLDAGRTKR
jgi:prevent-host-death family protein